MYLYVRIYFYNRLRNDKQYAKDRKLTGCHFLIFISFKKSLKSINFGSIKNQIKNITTLKIQLNPEVETKFKNYPKAIAPKLNHLRELILEVAEENGIDKLEETLKWGEPSYLAKKGSTLRMDWKTKTPNQYAMYFKCTSKLVETFRKVYGDVFQYEKNRAIIFGLEDEIPKKELKECIRVALTYHSIKHLPLLGL